MEFIDLNEIRIKNVKVSDGLLKEWAQDTSLPLVSKEVKDFG